MARLFNQVDANTGSYLYYGSPVVATGPLTIAAWFNTEDLTTHQCIVALSAEDADSYHCRTLYFRGATGGDPLQAREYNGTVGAASTSSGPGADAWHHGCAVYAGVDDRAVFLDGGSKGTDNTDLSTYPVVDNTTISSYYVWTGAANLLHYPFDGPVAEVGIWNVALTDAEVAVLAEGVSPLLVRPQSLVLYVPLIRDDDEDLVGGVSFTPTNGPTVAEHPPVLYAAKPMVLGVPAAAAGETLEIAVVPTDPSYWVQKLAVVG